ncbi:hypothetical protein OC861_002509 [Tilletia horrida]|nr:hypothetical protein OC845_002464 [Tilletia horrida]KAK0567766.1 hypothetical protein OC861_002509 [Tilletia horrida]
MTSSRSNRSSDLALRLGPPVLQLSCHVPDRHIEQALTDQRQIIKVQRQLLERLKLRTQQRARHASFLASHIAIVGMIPKEPFRQSEHEFLWSHLQNIFKAEPLVFASNDRKRAFAFAHLDESWRRGYESYLDRGGRRGRSASAENNWKNLSKYIRSGRAWY